MGYPQKEKLSYSFAKTLREKPFDKIRWELENEKKATTNMARGNLFEHALWKGNLDNCIIGKWETRCASHDKWANSIIESFKTELDEAVKTKADSDKIQVMKDRYEYYKKNQYMFASKKEYALANGALNFVGDKLKSYLDGCEYQQHFNAEIKHQYGGVGDVYPIPVHGYIDFADDDYVYDLKFVNSIDKRDFSKQVLKMGWDIQAWLYSHVPKNDGSGDFKQFKWICVEASMPHLFRVYRFNDSEFWESGERKFREACDLFLEFNSQKDVVIEEDLDAPYWTNRSYE